MYAISLMSRSSVRMNKTFGFDGSDAVVVGALADELQPAARTTTTAKAPQPLTRIAADPSDRHSTRRASSHGQRHAAGRGMTNFCKACRLGARGGAQPPS